MEDYSEMCDYEYLKKQIIKILTNEDLCAEAMVAEIGELVGVGGLTKMKNKESVWWVCRFSNGEYIGQDKRNGGFIRVHGLYNAYLAVEGELEDSAEALRGDDDFEILKVKVHGEDKITILVDNYIK